MLADLIIKYNKAKFEIIDKFSCEENSIDCEHKFIDKGYIKSRFEKFKVEDYKISSEIELLYENGKNNKDIIEKIKKMIDYQKSLQFEIAYLISNDINNISLSKKILNNIDTNFNKVLDGIEYYIKGDFEKSYDLLDSYYCNIKKFPEHYLINKIYAILLMRKKNYDLAIKIMRKSAEVVPDDLEIHKSLRYMYKETGNSLGFDIEDKLIKLLER